jgi:WD40 repeat protein
VQRLCYSAGSKLGFVDINRSTLFGEVNGGRLLFLVGLCSFSTLSYSVVVWYSSAHEFAVVGLATSYLPPALRSGAMPSSSKDARIFSAGADNMIRCWDAFDMSELFKCVTVDCWRFVIHACVFFTRGDAQTL